MNLASSAASTRSQARARCIPPPAAVAFTAAITGFSQSMTEETSRCQPVRMSRAASPTARAGAPSGRGNPGTAARRSAPVQKPFSPAPVSTTTLTPRSAEASSSQEMICSRIGVVMALPASGRLRVIQTTPSRTVRSTSGCSGAVGSDISCDG